MILTIYAHEYETQEEASREMDLFVAFSQEHEAELSVWQTQMIWPDRTRWAIVVADESDISMSFNWTGEPGEVAPEQALGFAQRRESEIAKAKLAGRVGLVQERKQYDAETGPVLSEDGEWGPSRGA